MRCAVIPMRLKEKSRHRNTLCGPIIHGFGGLFVIIIKPFEQTIGLLAMLEALILMWDFSSALRRGCDSVVNWVIIGSHQSYVFLVLITTLGPTQNGRRHFADDFFRCIFFNEIVWISIKTSLRFVPKGPINNIPALVQIMPWRGTGDKPLSEPMMIQFNDAYICVTQPQWVDDGNPLPE